MVAMTTAVLGPPRHGFAPMACGWWCEMEHYTYKDAARVEADNRSIDFLKDIGIDWVSDNHPWGGETERMNALRETDGYHPGPLVSKKYEHARKVGVRVVFWPTMNNTHPWWSGKGQPFLFEKKEWLQFPEKRSLKGMMLSGVTFTQIVQGLDQPPQPGRNAYGLFPWMGYGRRFLRRRRSRHTGRLPVG